MKKSMLSYALLLGLSPFLVQCVASEQDVRILDQRTRSLDSRATELERLNDTVRGQATSQARLGSELETLSNRLLQQEGRMDEAEHQRRRIQEQQNSSQQAMSIRLDNIDITLQEITANLKELDRRLAGSLADMEAQQEQSKRQLQTLQEQRAREAAERAAAADAAARAAEQARREAQARAQREAERQARETTAQSGPKELLPEPFKLKVEGGRTSTPDAPPETPAIRAATPPPAPPAEAPRPAAPPAAGPGAENYRQGLEHLERNNHQEAYSAFATYLEAAPRGEMAADARYLLGESLYQQEEYELAILEYQKVIADFVGHARVPEALLRQGMAFEKLREPSTAAIVYERLIGEFPASEYARKAKELLGKIR